MPQLIVFLGVQLSGKTTLAKTIAAAKRIRFLSIDDIRLALYGQLSGPKDWLDDDSRLHHNNQTKTAYDHLFKIIKNELCLGRSLIVEMPHLGDREEVMVNTVKDYNVDLKVVWCHLSEDNNEEIARRITARSGNMNSAQIRLEDYRMFKARIRKPVMMDYIEIDTLMPCDVCLETINNYLSNQKSLE